MATILFGPMVTGARGKLAGTIFSANGSGPYVRGWSRGSNPRTPLQTATRNAMTQFAPLWGDLTSGQHDDWNDYAAASAQELTNSLGEPYYISGFNWYLRINSHLYQAGASARDDAPDQARPGAPDVITFVLYESAGTGFTRVFIDKDDPTASEQHVIFCRLVYSLGIVAAPAGLQFMINEIPDVNGNLIFQTELEDAQGDIPAGTKAFAETYLQDDQGQRGPAVASSALAQA